MLGNAWKYTSPQGKRIELSVTGDATEVSIVVADNGVGIPGSEQKAIFDKFRRGSAAVNGGSTGTGLGLAVVRAIVTAHRGTIDVRSEENRGARFRILLPRQQAEAA